MVCIAEPLIEMAAHIGKSLVDSSFKIGETLITEEQAHKNGERWQSGGNSRDYQLDVRCHETILTGFANLKNAA